MRIAAGGSESGGAGGLVLGFGGEEGLAVLGPSGPPHDRHQ
jgi:hypothetical protein